MKINQDGINLIKSFESLQLESYLDLAKVWTIGYGHTGMTHNDGSVCRGRVITEATANALLKWDLEKFEKAVERNVKVKLNSNQFSALVSFTFNLGETNLRSSTMLKLLNNGKYWDAANEFPRWNKADGKVVAGLTRRRVAERDLFCSFPNMIGETD